MKEESEKAALKLRGMVQGGRREEGSGWGTRVYLWQIHAKPIQYCKVKKRIKNKQNSTFKKLRSWHHVLSLHGK